MYKRQSRDNIQSALNGNRDILCYEQIFPHLTKCDMFNQRKANDSSFSICYSNIGVTSAVKPRVYSNRGSESYMLEKTTV